MTALDNLKELLKGRNTEAINTFITKNPVALDEVDDNGISGLMYIGYHQLPDVLAFAIDKKADFTLYEAAAMGLLHRVITKVNSQPALLNQPAKDGFYALTLACFFGQKEVTAYLLKKGAKINQPAANPTKVMPLHSAVAKNDIELCDLLLKNGADVNAQQTQGVTPLMSAAHLGNLDLVKLLMENGADIKLTTDDGKTAITYAEQDGHQAILTYLQSSSSATNRYSYTMFGDFSLNEVDNLSLSIDIESEGKPLSLDINFEAPTVSEAQLALVNKILNNLSIYKDQTHAFILADAAEEDSVTDEYLTFHQEKGEEGSLLPILQSSTSERKRKKKLRKLLHLNRIGFYPNDEERYAIFDYTLGEEHTNYLLVVVLNSDDEIRYITMES